MYSRTSLVINENPKILGLVPFYYRKRSCDTNMTSNTPANQYQRQKLIQNTVRVPGSLYTMNLGALTATNPAGVCWNQQSDRPVPSVQKSTVPTGYNNSLNTRRYSVTSSRPGGQNPGGTGCDIKHNSYERYLNRLKGSKALRRGVVPENFGVPVIPPRTNVQGGKTMKTNIVSGCDCPVISKEANERIYNNPYYYDINNIKYQFNVGQPVYAKEGTNTYYSMATIIGDNEDGTYEVEFEDRTVETKTMYELKIYYPCACE